MKRMMRIVLLALLLTGCAGEKGIIDRDGYQLDTRHPAQAAYPRIKVLVIHYTADNFDVSLATLTDKEVSSHYLIPEQPPRYQHKPRIWQLVPEEDLAWHAGVSYWRGSTRINDTSIGIELENRGWQKTAGVKSFTPFHPEQIAALIPLARDIIARYHIAPQNVVAHADIAPQRKDDPGPLYSTRGRREDDRRPAGSPATSHVRRFHNRSCRPARCRRAGAGRCHNAASFAPAGG